MTQDENIELTRGHKEYDSKVKNLEGIFEKIEKILDVSKYKKDFKQIQYEVRSDSKLTSAMPSSNMQLDYEGFAFIDYNKKLDDLTKEIEAECMPFYELHLLSTRIDMQISCVSVENIGEIIQNTKVLIDVLNRLNTHNSKDKNLLVKKAYETIYSVIMYEEVFSRSDILSYINKLNIPANKENIGRLLSNDIKKLNEQDLVLEDLRTIKEEGLGYDYLNPEFVQKVSRKTVGEQNSEYQERKRQAINDISHKVIALASEKEDLDLNISNNKNYIKKLHINKSVLAARMLSIVLIPVVTFSAGRAIGKNSSNKIDEYQTITRTIDAETREVIGEPEVIYDERETTYAATITVYEPWRNNPTGRGYIRNVTAYEFISDETGEYQITREDLENNVTEKYKYVEPKEVLDRNDSMTDSTIMITETYQDKSVTQKSTKYILPFSILGLTLGVGADIAFALLRINNLKDLKDEMESLNNYLELSKETRQDLKEKLNEMMERAELLQEEYNDVVRKYGEFGDQFIISDIDTSWILGKAKRK